MLRYIVQRLLLMIPTLLGVAILVFLMLRVMGGDPVRGDAARRRRQRPAGGASRRSARASGSTSRSTCSSANGWAAWLTGDFGVSMWTGKPVSHEIAIRLELSLQVAIMATILAVLIAIPLGTLSALYKDTWIDHVDPRDLDRRARACRRSGSA